MSKSPHDRAIPGIDYCFTPFVAASLREDGRIQVTFDWSDCYQYSHDNYAHRVAAHDHDPHWAPYAEDLGAALDDWIARMPTTIIVNSMEGE